MADQCTAQFGDFDVYECDLPAGHEGFHHDPHGLLWAMGEAECCAPHPSIRGVQCSLDPYHDGAHVDGGVPLAGQWPQSTERKENR